MANQVKIVAAKLTAEGVDEVVRAFQKVSQEAQRRGKEGAAGLRLMNDAVQSLSAVLPQISAGLVVKEMYDLTKSAFLAADQIGKLSQKTGLTAETLSTLKVAASTADVEFDQLGKGLMKFNKFQGELQNGSKEAAKAVAQLFGKGNALDGLTTEQRFQKVTEALGRMPASFQKTQLAMEFFGKSGADLIPLMNDIADKGFEYFRKKAEETGQMVSSEFAEAAQTANDAITDLKGTVQGMAMEFSSGLAPAVADAAKEVRDFISATGGDDIQSAGETVGKVLRFFTGYAEDTARAVGWLLLEIDNLIKGMIELANTPTGGGFWDRIKGIFGDRWQNAKDITGAAAPQFGGTPTGPMQGPQLPPGWRPTAPPPPPPHRGTEDHRRKELQAIDKVIDALKRQAKAEEDARKEAERRAKVEEEMAKQVERMPFELAKRQGEQALKGLDLKHGQIELENLFPAQAAERYRVAVEGALPAMREHAALMKKTAITAEDAQAADEYALKVKELAASVDQAGQRMREFKAGTEGALKSALGDYLASGIEKAHGLRDAIGGLLQSLRAMAAQALANLLIEKLLSGFSSKDKDKGKAVDPVAATTLALAGVLVNQGGKSVQQGAEQLMAAASLLIVANAMGSGSGFAEGGYVHGPAAPVDRIPAWLTGGEYVLNRDTVARLGGKDVLDGWNFGRTAPSFRASNGYATGGMVMPIGGAQAGAGGSSELRVGLEPGLIATAVREFMRGPEGQKITIEHLGNNQKRAGQALGIR